MKKRWVLSGKNAKATKMEGP